MSNRFLFSTAIVTGLLLGCASAAPPPSPAAPTTMPADTVSIADAKPLADFETDGQETTFTDKLRPPLAAQTLYFGEADKYDSPEDSDPSATAPVLAVKTDDGFKAVAVPLPAAANMGWRYVAGGPSAGSIWACLDTVAGDSGPIVIVAHSTDSGATFKFLTFKKPCKIASFYDFGMNREGHGKITISLDTDCGKHKAGLYHFETTDAGATWSAEPRFEPDGMIHSEPVPDDEQPDADDVKKPTKTLFKSGTRSLVPEMRVATDAASSGGPFVAGVSQPVEDQPAVRDDPATGWKPVPRTNCRRVEQADQNAEETAAAAMGRRS